MAAPVKAQAVRVFDVMVLGPVMVAGGVQLVRGRNLGLGLFLVAGGIGTAAYNWVNYLRIAEREQKLKRRALLKAR